MSVSKSMTATSTPSNNYQHFATGHEDLVHDVAYDYYGRRMATVSSDQRLNVYDMNDENEWVISDSFRAHEASINRVIWGPPEHGQILVTCSYDRTVRIWEEQEMEPKGTLNRWKRQFMMTPETRTAILSIAFPPTFASTSSTSTGLKLGFISADGSVHIYECREPQDLTHWMQVDVFHVLPSAPPRETEISFCIAFCPSRWGGEQLVVGAMDTVRVYRHNVQGKFRPAEELTGHRGLVRDVSWAVSMGRSYNLVATACKDGHVRIFKLSAGVGKNTVARPATSKSTGQGGRRRGGAGLSQGLVGADEILPGPHEGDDGEDGDKWDVQMVADFGDHKSEVWKVSWNATGTILSSTGDDGKIRLWKAAISGEFQLLSIISTPRSRDEIAEED